MPGMSGIDVIKKVKLIIKNLNLQQEMIKLVEPEFIIVTAYDTPAFCKHAKKDGVD
jgi:YesN/AraC family two-component response regulator